MNNWKTTIAGLMLAIAIAAKNVPDVPQQYRWIFSVIEAASAAVLGLTAKDYSNHSTLDEVEKSTANKK